MNDWTELKSDCVKPIFKKSYKSGDSNLFTFLHTINNETDLQFQPVHVCCKGSFWGVIERRPKLFSKTVQFWSTQHDVHVHNPVIPFPCENSATDLSITSWLIYLKNCFHYWFCPYTDVWLLSAFSAIGENKTYWIKPKPFCSSLM